MLRVWDTEHNNGVLIYLLLAEHAIEICSAEARAKGIDLTFSPEAEFSTIYADPARIRPRPPTREGHPLSFPPDRGGLLYAACRTAVVS